METRPPPLSPTSTMPPVMSLLTTPLPLSPTFTTPPAMLPLPTFTRSPSLPLWPSPPPPSLTPPTLTPTVPTPTWLLELLSPRARGRLLRPPPPWLPSPTPPIPTIMLTPTPSLPTTPAVSTTLAAWCPAPKSFNIETKRPTEDRKGQRTTREQELDIGGRSVGPTV